MAQLIKIYDYISRYESDIYHYPTKYIRLKQENWIKLKKKWESGYLRSTEKEDEDTEYEKESPSKWKNFFKRKKEYQEDVNKIVEEEWVPEDIETLKKYFLDGLYPFQLKWASTTLLEKSFVDANLQHNSQLKMLLQRIPDHYLIMYKPIVKFKKAPMEAEIIVIGPHQVEVITYLDVNADIITPHTPYQWYVEKNGEKKTVSSPLIGLKRTETFLRSIAQKYKLNINFKLTILAPEVTISALEAPYLTSYIDKHNFEQWLTEKRKLSTPLKYEQLLLSEKLLNHTRTVAVKRPEWESDNTKE
ncbi:NERD domain-containing protein [Halobacillus sp. B23F22_1]|uniref:NERD domain-containing protein n=1 Tax=Halobacillus sp. B23F22_1 TaxID=3459514 RepID=UPI00373F6D8C